MKIPRLPVKSSQIASIGYSPETQQLDIEFTNRSKDATKPPSVYRYANITQKDYDDLVNAESIGSHFISRIKGFPNRHPFKKMEGE